MKCAEARELLSAYIDGALSGAPRRRLEDHLRECPTCAAELADLRRTAALLASLDEIDPPAEFRASLRQRLQEVTRQGRPRERTQAAQWWLRLADLSMLPTRTALAAALVLLLAFAGGIGVGYRYLQGRIGAPVAQDAARDEAGPATLGAPAGTAPGAAGRAAKGEVAGQAPVSGGAAVGQGSGAQKGAPPADLFTAAVDSARAAADSGQKIVRNGSIELAVSDVAAAEELVTQIATAYGGYVENSSYQQISATTARAVLSLRLPAAQLDQALSEVEKLGQVRTKVTTASDVTAAYTDVEARLKNLQAQEERLRGLIARAATVDEVLRIESELSRVRTDIDVALATLKNLQSGVELATLTVSLEQDPGAVATGASRPFWDRVRGAFANTLRALGRLLAGLVITIGGALPVLAILAVLWLLVRPQRWFRRG